MRARRRRHQETGFRAVFQHGNTWRLYYLVQDEPVQVRHVPLVGDGTLVVVFEVLLQRHGVMRDVHHRAQVVRKHLQSPEARHIVIADRF